MRLRHKAQILYRNMTGCAECPYVVLCKSVQAVSIRDVIGLEGTHNELSRVTTASMTVAGPRRIIQ